MTLAAPTTPGPRPAHGDGSARDRRAQPGVLFLCTGNAARSVMAQAMLEAAGVAVHVRSAGTHVVEHQPASVRTRAALRAVGFDVALHRSRQLTEADLDDVDLVVAMAAEHVRYVRRRHPAATGRVATMPFLAERLPGRPGSLAERVAGLDLGAVDPAAQGDVDDPAGGDDDDYLRCARRIAALTEQLAPRLV